MINKSSIVTLFLIFFLIVLSGCLDLLSSDINNSITYESHPTALLYTISYGYRVNCTDSGEYTIKYDCDIPEVISGNIITITAHNDNYTEKILATNNLMKSWDISSSKTKEYDLGITATVSSNSYMIPNLNEKNSLKIEEIRTLHPNIFNQYTQEQGNDTIVFIQPNNLDVINVSTSVLNKAGTSNSFIIAKELFKWIKKQTSYKPHIKDNSIQTASFTINCKTGDCDDLSFLYISLCRSIGIPARFIKGFLIQEDEAIPHAWVEVFIGGEVGNNGWIPIECAGNSGNISTEINQNFGIESANHLRLFKDDGSNQSINISMAGLYITYLETKTIKAEAYSDVNNYLVVKSNQLVIDENGIRSYK
jgi:hypothetical protein